MNSEVSTFPAGYLNMQEPYSIGYLCTQDPYSIGLSLYSRILLYWLLVYARAIFYWLLVYVEASAFSFIANYIFSLHKYAKEFMNGNIAIKALKSESGLIRGI